MSIVGTLRTFSRNLVILVLVCLLSGAVAGIAWRRVTLYEALLEYSADTAYAYRFDPSYAREIPIAISADGLVWPELDGECDTALLEVAIEVGLIGRMVDPFLEVSLGETAVRQYFERGGAGLRYVNVSRIARQTPSPGARVQLAGGHLSWRRGQARLLLFQNQSIGDESVLVVAAHPDDAELAAFGLYSASRVWVVTVTAGEAGMQNYRALYPDKKIHYMKKGRLRVWDSIVVPQLGGVPPQRTANLGYFDGTLQEMYQQPTRAVFSIHTGVRDIGVFRQHNISDWLPESPKEATWGALVGDLAAVLEKVRPDVIVTAHPVLDGHSDHRFASFAVVEALRSSGLGEGRLLLYANHASHSELFPFGPPDGTIALPPSFGQELLFEQVYSRPLSDEQRKAKLLALDSMHDLRESPTYGVQTFPGLLKAEIRRARRYLWAPDKGYLRRALRPNELFFVISYANSERFFRNFLNEVEGEEATENRSSVSPGESG